MRSLTKEEVVRLGNALPPHQRQLTRFALATGLRQANVLDLQWSAVDLGRRTAWVHADEAKGGEAIGVPLNDDAIAVLREENGKHPERVFTYKGRPFRSGEHGDNDGDSLKRADIRIFVGTTCGTDGQRGTSWPVRRSRNCRSSARGSRR